LKGGFELAYYRHLTGPLTVGVPLKLGIFKTPEELNNRTLLSLDGILMLQHFVEGKTLHPYLFAGVGLANEDFNLKKFFAEAPGGVGLNIRLAPQAYFTMQTEYRYSFGQDRDNLQYSVGLQFALDKEAADKERERRLSAGQNDSDGDGLDDAQDDCPHEPGPRIFNGCPDSDGDGIPDYKDKCPEHVGIPVAGGCPDTDRDGVDDFDDPCPEIAGTANGCPDRDKDGIPDAEDPCPEEAGIAGAGCPEGHPNAKENRFTTKGYGSISDEDRDILNVALRNVEFEYGKAQLLNSSLVYLDRVAGVMEKYPEYRLHIVGHTDSIGDKVFNQSLSEKRARACYDYLITQGINSGRITFEGMGESQPIANNKYKAGRKLNRRVEFRLEL
jgi:outer membrane protein OmpA-like peptidoglycan-associated protein